MNVPCASKEDSKCQITKFIFAPFFVYFAVPCALLIDADATLHKKSTTFALVGAMEKESNGGSLFSLPDMDPRKTIGVKQRRDTHPNKMNLLWFICRRTEEGRNKLDLPKQREKMPSISSSSCPHHTGVTIDISRSRAMMPRSHDVIRSRWNKTEAKW